MAKKVKKTNAARILDDLNIPYQLVTYPVDDTDLSAVHVAQLSGLNINMIFKPLVVRSDKDNILMAVIGGADQLNLKALAKASNSKSVALIPLNDLFPITGYLRGGCSPLGAKKNFPVFLDQRALSLDNIAISAGIRGAQIILNPRDFVAATNASVAFISA